MANSITAGGDGYFLINGKEYQRGAYEYAMTGGTAGNETHIMVYVINDRNRKILDTTEITTIEGSSGTYADANALRTALQSFFFRKLGGGGGGGGVTSVNGDVGPSVNLNLDDIPNGSTNIGFTQTDKDQIDDNSQRITATELTVIDNNNDITTLFQTKVNSVTAGTPNVSITGTATDPVVNVAQTTAGLLTNVFFTADEVTTTEGTFYQVLINDRGTAQSATQTVDLDDNQSGAFPQDFLGNVQTEDRPILAGVYAGFPILQVNIGQSNQRFKIESYICDSEGVPLGIGNGPVGTLGVNTVLIADSGIIDLQPNNPTSVNCQGSVPNALTLATGQRFRYVIIAEKVGSGGGVKTFSLFSGADYNSFFQIPTAGGSGPDKAQYVVSFSKSGLVSNIVVLESRSSFTTPTGKYFGGNTTAFLKGIKFTTGVSQANAAGSFVVQVRYEDAGGAQQHVVGGGTLLKEQELLSTNQATSAVFNQANEVIFTPVQLVGDKVYFVDISQMGFFQFTDLEVELLIETELSPSSFIF